MFQFMKTMSTSLDTQRTTQSSKFYGTTDELTEPEEVKILLNGKSTSIPTWFSGTYLRVGPGHFDFQDFAMKSWLDGYAIISKFQVGGQSVKFEKKFLKTDSYERAKKANRPCICEFGTRAFSDPNKGWMSRLYNTLIPEFSDNANCNLFNVGNSTFVTGETCYFYDLKLDSLSAGQKFDTNRVFGLNSVSPHPLTDKDGYTYNVGSSYAPSLKYSFLRISPTDHNKDPKEALKKGKVLCSIPSRWNRNIMSYNHSFGITDKYLVYIEQPYVVNLNKILSSVIIKGQCFKDWTEWLPEEKNRFYIIDKKTGKVVCNGVEFMSEESFFFVHMINCYEENGQVVCNVSVYDNPEVLEQQDLTFLREGGTDNEDSRAYGQKYVIPIDVDMSNAPEDNLVKVPHTTATAYKRNNQIHLTPERLTPKGVEFPTINKKFLGSKNRYYYASGLTSIGEFRNAVVKVDTVKKKIIPWKASDPNQVMGEAIFASNPDAKNSESEDDGIIIVPCTDFREDAKDAILFLDAKTMKELGRSEFSTQIPPAIHGLFIPS